MRHKFLLILLIFSSFFLVANDSTKIYLATIGPGDDIFLRWGHFAIVVDYPDKPDVLFDYGNFSFQQDQFIPNFIKGIMTYFKYKKSADFELAGYMNANRTITLQELNLTQEQVQEYIDKLLDEVKPENRFYQYDHYYNNCVSQMSDFLDELSNGEFYKGTSKLTGRSFRDLSRDYVSSNYMINLLIMFVLGSKVDYNINEKEAMFLPDYTMNRADHVFIQSNGDFIPLVKEKTVVYQSVNRDPVIVNSKPKTLLNLFIGIILAVLSLLILKIRILKGFQDIIAGLIMGFSGSILFFMSFFTGHYYIHNNWNLILVNPLTFTLFVGGLIQLRKKHYGLGIKISRIYVDSTLLFTIIMLMLKSINLIKQDNLEIIMLFLPILIVNSSFMTLFSFYSGSSNKLPSSPSISLDASSSASLDEMTTVEDSGK
ncbi:MAG: DUF4105 domain-containing protein [Spirochaetales bacterium]|nr:DUF4105 domain-containing protein [Spirochaetales bacterium]